MARKHLDLADLAGWCPIPHWRGDPGVPAQDAAAGDLVCPLFFLDGAHRKMLCRPQTKGAQLEESATRQEGKCTCVPANDLVFAQCSRIGGRGPRADSAQHPGKVLASHHARALQVPHVHQALTADTISGELDHMHEFRVEKSGEAQCFVPRLFHYRQPV